LAGSSNAGGGAFSTIADNIKTALGILCTSLSGSCVDAYCDIIGWQSVLNILYQALEQI